MARQTRPCCASSPTAARSRRRCARGSWPLTAPTPDTPVCRKPPAVVIVVSEMIGWRANCAGPQAGTLHERCCGGISGAEGCSLGGTIHDGARAGNRLDQALVAMISRLVYCRPHFARQHHCNTPARRTILSTQAEYEGPLLCTSCRCRRPPPLTRSNAPFASSLPTRIDQKPPQTREPIVSCRERRRSARTETVCLAHHDWHAPRRLHFLYGGQRAARSTRKKAHAISCHWPTRAASMNMLENPRCDVNPPCSEPNLAELADTAVQPEDLEFSGQASILL